MFSSPHPYSLLDYQLLTNTMLPIVRILKVLYQDRASGRHSWSVQR